MTSMPCLIMQYKPYIVEQSCMGASRRFVCVNRQQTPMSTNQCSFQSTNYCTHTLKEFTKVCNASRAYFFLKSVIISFICKWQLNNIGLVLHNQTWHTRHAIVVHMKLSELYSMHFTSRSCLNFFLCNPYMPLRNGQFFNLLVEIYRNPLQ